MEKPGATLLSNLIAGLVALFVFSVPILFVLTLIPPEPATPDTDSKGAGGSTSLTVADRIQAYLYMAHCSLGVHSEPCKQLGRIYESALVFPRDRKEAARFYKIACDLDDYDTCHQLEALYVKSKELADKLPEAEPLAKKASEGGETKAAS